jgi:hypothetical protein
MRQQWPRDTATTEAPNEHCGAPKRTLVAQARFTQNHDEKPRNSRCCLVHLSIIVESAHREVRERQPIL